MTSHGCSELCQRVTYEVGVCVEPLVTALVAEHNHAESVWGDEPPEQVSALKRREWGIDRVAGRSTNSSFGHG
jgi:hypothetical protein